MTNHSIINQHQYLSLLLKSIIAGLLTAGIVYAWTNPTANPPSGGGALYYYNGNVGIGTTTPTQKLSVAGTIESTSGGIKFPDGTTQASAAKTIVFAAYKDVNQLVGTDTWTKITFPNEEFDIDNYYDTSNSRYTPPSGIYYIGGSYLQINGARDMLIAIYKNGVRVKEYYGNTNSGGGGNTHIEAAISVNGTDYIELYARFGADTTLIGNSGKTYFYGFKI